MERFLKTKSVLILFYDSNNAAKLLKLPVNVLF